MSAPLRFGVVGAGRVFQQYHLPSILARPEFEIVAVCDAAPDQARATLAAAKLDPMVVTDLDEFFALGRLDALAVCSPNDAHTAPMLAALAAGIPVLCEKPLAADLDEARAIATAAEDRPLAGVNLPYRFHDLVPVFLAELGGAPVDELTMTFNTAGQRVWRPVSAWYSDVNRAGGGALLDLGPHALDLLETLFGPAVIDACRMDRPVGEERVEVDLTFAHAAATVRIDRASRRLGLTIEAHQGDRITTFDVRRGEVHGAAGVARTELPRPELAAISQFLDAVTPGTGRVVPIAEALRLQESIDQAYRMAQHDLMAEV